MKIIISIFLLLCSYNLFAQQPQSDCSSDAGFKNKEELFMFTESLKTAGSAATLSPMISYPLRVNKGSNKHFMIKSESELTARFKEVFPDEILKAIYAQEPKATFCNYQGLTIGEGAVWINKKNGKTGIYVVNLPAKK